MFKIICKSIKIKIIMLLFIVTAVTSTIFSIYNYNNQKNDFKQKLEEKADRKIKRFIQNLVIPLWEVDAQWVNKIIDTEMLDKKLYAVIVSGEGDIEINKQRNMHWDVIDGSSNKIEGKLIKRSGDIIHGDVKIGDVTIFMTQKYLDESLKNEAIKHFVATMLLVFFLIITLYIILDRFILKPLENILHTTKSVAQGDYTQRVEVKQYDEIGELGDGFNHMMQSVKDKEEVMISQSRHAAMGEMISMIAHQWRQPISVIAMGANNILADVELDMLEDDTLRSGAKNIIHQTQELSKTIDDFRNFFRPGKVAEEILPEDIFNEAFSVIGKSLENSNVEVISEFKNGKKINTYSRELMQVLINILKNAKEALVEKRKKDRKILISIKDNSSEIVIKICDNAGGIKEDIQSKIFDPYFTTKDNIRGTGLGLYMSKTIVERHLMGTLITYNKDGGACFEIKLPYILK